MENILDKESRLAIDAIVNTGFSVLFIESQIYLVISWQPSEQITPFHLLKGINITHNYKTLNLKNIDGFIEKEYTSLIKFHSSIKYVFIESNILNNT